MKSSSLGRRLGSAALVLGLVGCGEEKEDDGGGAAAGGTVAGEWAQYCVATFEDAHEITDEFGDVVLEAGAGDKYLLAYLDEDGSAQILYLTDVGPIEFDVDGDPSPFRSNCSPDALQQHVGVFADVTVYKDEALTDEACRLTAGTSRASRGFGYTAVGDSDEPVYEVSIGDLAELCGGRESGFLRAKSYVLGGTEHTVVPIAAFRGPASGD